jgi:hypothetical protein
MLRLLGAHLLLISLMPLSIVLQAIIEDLIFAELIRLFSIIATVLAYQVLIVRVGSFT